MGRWRSREAVTKRRAFDVFEGLRPFLFRTLCLGVEGGKERQRALAVVDRVHGVQNREENRPADRWARTRRKCGGATA